MHKLTILLLTILTPLLLSSQSMYQKQTFSRQGQTLQYRILYPEQYNKKKAYPVLTFLHGSGERGSDNEAQLLHGGSLFEREDIRKQFPAIIIFPQCPNDSAWNRFNSRPDSNSPTGRSRDLSFSPQPSTPALLVKLLLDSLVKAKLADANRMYIGGLSLGGFGTFDMIERYPDFFAAAVPICGGGDTSVAGRFANKISVWLFHGDSDKSVDVKYSREYYNALKKRGADVRYTEYPGVGHNSWDNAFAEKDLMPWVFSKSRRVRVNR